MSSTPSAPKSGRPPEVDCGRRRRRSECGPSVMWARLADTVAWLASWSRWTHDKSDEWAPQTSRIRLEHTRQRRPYGSSRHSASRPALLAPALRVSGRCRTQPLSVNLKSSAPTHRCEYGQQGSTARRISVTTEERLDLGAVYDVIPAHTVGAEGFEPRHLPCKGSRRNSALV